MKIAVASDHGGFALKEEIKQWLIVTGFEITDYGTHNTESCDYPDFAFAAAKSVADKVCDFGFLFCTTGTGMAICANKVKGVRCALPFDTRLAELSRSHNNANMCAFGASALDAQAVKKIIETFLATEFAGGRHEKRVQKIALQEV